MVIGDCSVAVMKEAASNSSPNTGYTAVPVISTENGQPGELSFLFSTKIVTGLIVGNNSTGLHLWVIM